MMMNNYILFLDLVAKINELNGWRKLCFRWNQCMDRQDW